MGRLQIAFCKGDAYKRQEEGQGGAPRGPWGDLPWAEAVRCRSKRGFQAQPGGPRGLGDSGMQRTGGQHSLKFIRPVSGED